VVVPGPDSRVTHERELLSPQEVAGRLGFSPQQVVRLIKAGRLEAKLMAGSGSWGIPLSSVFAFKDRMDEADRSAGRFARTLDELGAPLE
jgi:hypothetical protein